MSEELRKGLIRDLQDKFSSMSEHNRSIWYAIICLMEQLK
jgi:hypothetical protein